MRLPTPCAVILYAAALLTWNYICLHHYSVQERNVQERVVRRPQRLKQPPVAEVLSVDGPARREVAAARSETASMHSVSAAPSSDCPKRRPYHTLLTTQATTYQQWQSRIMYFHWKKQAAADGPCTDMTGFTRLVASEDGKSDGLEGEMPSAFVRQYTTREIARYGHFGVLNRPFSVQQFVDSGGLTRIREDYVYIAETDHVLMRPLPNLASETEPAAFGFGYMYASSSVQQYVTRHCGGGTSWSQLQPVGPSPLIVSKRQLAKLTPLWLNISLALKLDREADQRFGWVLEMWGYAMSAAKLGIRHSVHREFQTEGGAGISARSALSRGTFIFHYTYGIEYTMGGRPQGANQIGEWSLDKRHYGSAYPPRKLQGPPDGASDGAAWLTSAWNEASAGIPSWPSTRALGTIGWRRVAGDGIGGSKLAARVQGTAWKWSGVKGLSFGPGGTLTTPWGKGAWGVLPTGVDYNDDGFCSKECLFVDFSGAMHNVRFELDRSPPTFKTYRLSDGESIEGTADS